MALPFEQRAALARFLASDDVDDVDDVDELDNDFDDFDDEDEDDEDMPAALPAVRLAPTHELAAAARASVTMRALQQLDQWLAEGRAVTETGALTSEEARSLHEALGWEHPDAEAGTSRFTYDSPQLDDLWTLATEAGCVDVQGDRAIAGPARAPLRAMDEVSAEADEQVLGLWQQAFDTLLLVVPDVTRFGFHEDDVADTVLDALIAAYEEDHHTVDDLVEELFEYGLPQQAPEIREVALSYVRRRVLDVIDRLAELGAADPMTEDDEFVSLTPLGVHGLRQFVLARGADAPVVEDVTGLPADRAAEQILAATPRLSRQLVGEWLAPRERMAALHELAAVLRNLPAARRRQLLTLLMTIEEVPRGLEELSADEPLLGPLVRASLAEGRIVRDLPLEGLEDDEGVDEQTAATMLSVVQGLAWRDAHLPPGDRDVLVVDAVARAVADVEPPVRADDVDPDYWSLLDETTVLRMERSVHPEAAVVIAAIATGHPTGRIRKAAKKVQHKRLMARRD